MKVSIYVISAIQFTVHDFCLLNSQELGSVSCMFLVSRCGQVCKSWNEIIQQDKRARFKRRAHLSEVEAALEVIFNVLITISNGWLITTWCHSSTQVRNEEVWLLAASSRYFLSALKGKLRKKLAAFSKNNALSRIEHFPNW